MRNLLFKHEMKAKRVKAIKSKTFHRHNRKTGAMKVIDGETGEEIGDDDAALEGLDPDNSAEAKREYLRAQERMLLKHKKHQPLGQTRHQEGTRAPTGDQRGHRGATSHRPGTQA